MIKNGAIEVYKKTFLDGEKLNNLVFSKVKEKDCFAVFSEDKVVSCGFLNVKKLAVGSKVFCVPFLFGLATLNEYKNKGYARKIITDIVNNLKQKKAPLLLLYPFPVDKSFYENFSFSTFSFASEFALNSLVIKNSVIKENVDKKSVYNLYNKVIKNYDFYQYLNKKDFDFYFSKINAFCGKTFGLYYKDYLYGFLCFDGDNIEDCFFDYEFIFNNRDKLYSCLNAENQLPKNLLVHSFITDLLENKTHSSVLIRPVDYIEFLKVFKDNFFINENYSYKFLIKDEILGDIKIKISVFNNKIRFFSGFVGEPDVIFTPREFTDYVLFSKNSHSLLKTKKSINHYAFLDKY